MKEIHASNRRIAAMRILPPQSKFAGCAHVLTAGRDLPIPAETDNPH